MKYYRTLKGEQGREEITHDKALNILLGCYRDNDMTRDMLTIPNHIDTTYSIIDVVSDDGMAAMAGLWNLLPDFAYDDNGNRKAEQ